MQNQARIWKFAVPVTRLLDIQHVTYEVRSSPDEVVYPFFKNWDPRKYHFGGLETLLESLYCHFNGTKLFFEKKKQLLKIKVGWETSKRVPSVHLKKLTQ